MADAAPNASIDAASQTSPAGDVPSSLSESISALTRGDFREASAGLIEGVIIPAGMALVLLIVTYFITQWISRG